MKQIKQIFLEGESRTFKKRKKLSTIQRFSFNGGGEQARKREVGASPAIQFFINLPASRFGGSFNSKMLFVLPCIFPASIPEKPFLIVAGFGYSVT